MRKAPNSPEISPCQVEFRKKRRKQRPFIFVFFILICVIAWLVGAYLVSGSAQQENLAPANNLVGYPVASASQGRITDTYSTQENGTYPASYQTTFRALTFSQLAGMSNDHLLLVNKDYGMPDYMAGNLVEIAGYVTALNNDILLNEDALAMLEAMFDSATASGFTQFRVTQGFRTHEYQQDLYNQMAGTGLAARPGHSEHQVGLAVDISYHGVSIGNSIQGTWLANYSYRYGFILRYPEHKTDITGVPFEPWHFRYVGQPHAYFMTHRDIVLEEYIAYLESNRMISVAFEGVVFTIFYLLSEDEVLEIPDSHSFWVSRDNTGGIIVTTWRF